MKIEIADASGLPEHVRPLAETADGKTYLDLSALAPAAELERFQKKALTAEGEAIERRKALKAWEAIGADPATVAAKLASGADPAIVQQLQAKNAEIEATYKAKFADMLRARALADFKAELSKAGVVPEGLDLLATFAAPRITFDEDGGMRVLSDDGKTPMIGKGANGGATLADLAAKLAGAIPHLVADKGNGGGGKPPGSIGGMPGKTISRAEFMAQPPHKQAELVRSGVTPID